MIFRGLLVWLLVFFLARAVWRLLQGVAQGATSGGTTGQRRSGPPALKLARDPVCGTFVVPGKAVEFARGGETMYFCSDACRRRFLEKA